MAAEIDRKARAERLKKLFDEENEKYEEELKATDNEHLLVEKVKKSLFQIYNKIIIYLWFLSFLTISVQMVENGAIDIPVL